MLSNIASELIGAIYESAVRPRAWPVVVNTITDGLHAKVAAFNRFDPLTQEWWSVAPRATPEFQQGYAAYCRRQIPRTFDLHAPCHFNLTSKRDAELLQKGRPHAQILKDWYSLPGLEVVLGADLGTDGTNGAIFALWRPIDSGPFDAQESELFAALIPHLARSLATQSLLDSLSSRQELCGEALDQLAHGVVLINGAGRACLANRAAEEILSCGRGIRYRGGFFEAETEHETTALRNLIGDCTRIGGDRRRIDAVRLSRGAGEALIVRGISRRVTNWHGALQCTAILFLIDPARKDGSLDGNLKRLYRLTSAEAKVALAVLDGFGIKAAAERLGISQTTTRTHLYQVFAKTGVRRQAEMVRLILQLHGVLLDDGTGGSVESNHGLAQDPRPVVDVQTRMISQSPF
jgi:DNA-binding CsgD family transcriptional regulator